MFVWEYIVVGLFLVGAITYTAWYYLGKKKKQATNLCIGSCADCPYADHKASCSNTDLRQRFLDEKDAK